MIFISSGMQDENIGNTDKLKSIWDQANQG
jgi:hypothetical protein